MRGVSARVVLAVALGGFALAALPRESRADFLCGGGGQPPPSPTTSSSSDAGADAAPDADVNGAVGYHRRPCMSGAPWSGPSVLDFGMVAGMFILGSGAAASSRKKK
jgi:hypothetical protein